MPSWIFQAFVLLSLVTPGWAIGARQQCSAIGGEFTATLVPPADCTAKEPLVCTAGRLSGALEGEYKFAMSTAQAADSAVPSIAFFTGHSTITSKPGDTLEAFDAGTLDHQTGGFSSLITITRGTGSYAGATGQLRVTGLFDPKARTTAGDYRGTLCRP